MYDDLIDAFMDALDDAPSDLDFLEAAKALQSGVIGRDVERQTPKRPIATQGSVDHSQLTERYFEPGYGPCHCNHCKTLPWP